MFHFITPATLYQMLCPTTLHLYQEFSIGPEGHGPHEDLQPPCVRAPLPTDYCGLSPSTAVGLYMYFIRCSALPPVIVRCFALPPATSLTIHHLQKCFIPQNLDFKPCRCENPGVWDEEDATTQFIQMVTFQTMLAQPMVAGVDSIITQQTRRRGGVMLR